MKFTPTTIFNRFLLIIAIPIIIFEVTITYIFYERHWENVSEKMSTALINEIKLFTDINSEVSAKSKAIATVLNFQIEVVKHTKIDDIHINSNLFTNQELKAFIQKLKDEIKFPTKAIYLNDRSDVRVFIQKNHDILQIDFSRKRIQSPTTLIFIGWVIGTATLLIIIALIFMKNQVRSIVELSEVAEKLGKGQEIARFKLSGADEIRTLGKAFIRMKQRIERQINYRAEMLAHISHDLRTPLTRLKLHISLLHNHEATKEMQRDVKEMENLIIGYLNFAKEEGNEPAMEFNICKELKDLIIDYNNTKIHTKFQINSLVVNMKKEAIKRAVKNLLNNALKYCNKRIKVTTNKLGKNFYITIDDDGSGIPEDKHKMVFKPFYKLNPESEGFGLGLAIVKNIIYIHGGKLRLDTSPLGGLRVIIRLPL